MIYRSSEFISAGNLREMRSQIPHFGGIYIKIAIFRCFFENETQLSARQKYALL